MNVIKVQGSGHASMPPDRAVLTFEVTVKKIEYADCMASLNLQTEYLRKSMAEAGLADKELKTTDYSVDINREYRDGKTCHVGYQASHKLNVEIPADKVTLNKALQCIAEGHSGAEISIKFTVKDQDSLRRAAIADAVRKATDNARTLAEAAGVKLGRLVQMDYGWSEVRIYESSAELICEGAPLMKPEYDADIEPEDVGARDNVTLVFEIGEAC